MTLRESARKLVNRGEELQTRVEALENAAELARGRLDDAVVDEAEQVADRASRRLRLSADHTVVALAGATGSGKSSTYNALSGLELSAVGVRRPTTSWASACVWGTEGAEEILDWLDIPPRHRVTRDSMLDSSRVAREDTALDGVVLLDLPDHDSTEVSHHLEVDRLVQQADLLVWVLDPQKYADAAVHDRYLAPLVTHQDVMIVVLNQIDAVPLPRREAMVADLRRVLDREGLTDVPIYPVSARQGEGIDELRQEIADRVAAKKATKERMLADTKAAARRLAEASGERTSAELTDKRVHALDEALAQAAGVPTVVAAVESSTRMRAGRATGWPVISWFSRLRPDPLKRLHLDLGEDGRSLTGTARTSLPEPTQVQRAKVDTEVRALAEDASSGVGPAWQRAIREASVSRLPDLNDRLDKALGQTDLGVAKLPGWASLVRVLQWLLILVALAGLVWFGGVLATRWITGRSVDMPQVAGFPLPLILLVGGVLLGILLALLCRLLVRATARSRARSADRRLREAISEVSGELVVGPIEQQLADYVRLRKALDAVLR